MDYYALIGSSAEYNMPLLDRLLHVLRGRVQGADVPSREIVDATAVQPLVAEISSYECALFVKESIDAAALIVIACDWGVISPPAAASFINAFLVRALRYFNPNELGMVLRIVSFCKRPSTVRMGSDIAQRVCKRIMAMDARELCGMHPNSMCHILAAISSLPPDASLYPQVALRFADEAVRRVNSSKEQRKAEKAAFAAQQDVLRDGKTVVAERIGLQVPAPGAADDTPTAADSAIPPPSIATAQQTRALGQEPEVEPEGTADLYFRGDGPAAPAVRSRAPRPADTSSGALPLPQDSPAALRARENWERSHGTSSTMEGESPFAPAPVGSFLEDRQRASMLIPRTARLVRILSLGASLGGVPRTHALWQVVVDKTTSSAEARLSSSRPGAWADHDVRTGYQPVGPGQAPLPRLSAKIISEALWALAIAQPRAQPHASLARGAQGGKQQQSSPSTSNGLSATLQAVTEAEAAAGNVSVEAAVKLAAEALDAAAADTAAAPGSAAASDAATSPLGEPAATAPGPAGAATGVKLAGPWTATPFVALGKALSMMSQHDRGAGTAGVRSLSHEELVRLLWAYARTGYWAKAPSVVGRCARELADRLRAGAGAPHGLAEGGDVERFLAQGSPISVSVAARAAYCLGAVASSSGAGGPAQAAGHWLPTFFSALQDEMLRRWRHEPDSDWARVDGQSLAMMAWGCAQARAGTYALFQAIGDGLAAGTAADRAAWLSLQEARRQSAVEAATPAMDEDGFPIVAPPALSSLGTSTSPESRAPGPSGVDTSGIPLSESETRSLGRHHADPAAQEPGASSHASLSAALLRLQRGREEEQVLFQSSPLACTTLWRWSAAEVSMLAWAFAQLGVAHEGLFDAIANTARASWWVPSADDRRSSQAYGATRRHGASGGVLKADSDASSASALPAVQYYWLPNLLYAFALAGQVPRHPRAMSAFCSRLYHLPPPALARFSGPQLQLLYHFATTLRKYNSAVLGAAGLLRDRKAPALSAREREERRERTRALPTVHFLPETLEKAVLDARLSMVRGTAWRYAQTAPTPLVSRCREMFDSLCRRAEAAAGAEPGSVLRPQWEIVTAKGHILDMAVIVFRAGDAPRRHAGAGGEAVDVAADDGGGEGRSGTPTALLRLAVEVEGSSHFQPEPYPVETEDGGNTAPPSMPRLPHPFLLGQEAPLSQPVHAGPAGGAAQGVPMWYNPSTRARHAFLEASGWRVVHVCYRSLAAIAQAGGDGRVGTSSASGGGSRAGAVQAAQREYMARCIAEAGVDLQQAVRAALAPAPRERDASAAAAAGITHGRA